MKWHLFLFLIFKLTATTDLFSQVFDRPMPRISTDNSSSINQALMESKSIGYKDVGGSPYLYDEFKNGNVYYGGKHTFEQIPIRLNLFDDQLEFKQKDKVMVLSNPDRIDSITIGEEVFTYLQERRNYKVTGFVKLLNSNTPALFTKMKIVFVNKKDSTSPHDQSKAGRFERVPDQYYIKNRFDEVKKVTTVKKFIKEFGKHREELTEYSKSQGISVNDPEDLVKLIDYYHDLEN